MNYKILSDFEILRINDMAVIPINVDNADYQQYLIWLSEGNIPLLRD